MPQCLNCGISIDFGNYCYHCHRSHTINIDAIQDHHNVEVYESRQKIPWESIEEIRPHDENSMKIEYKFILTKKHKTWIISIVLMGIGLFKAIEYLVICYGIYFAKTITWHNYDGFGFSIVIYLLIIFSGMILYSYSRE